MTAIGVRHEGGRPYTRRKAKGFKTHLPRFTCANCGAIQSVWIHDPVVESEVVGYQDEMVQRYVANALSRARAHLERVTSEAEESGEPAGV